MRLLDYVLLLAITVSSAPLPAQTSPMLGDWREPAGSIIHIEKCSTGICLRLLSLGPKAPSTTDLHNTDAALRGRLLCNLEIGSHFDLTDATHASGGRLYDPKSGRTYSGTMVVKGDTLKLRGYVGAPIFGRTEIWQRFVGVVASCRGTEMHPDSSQKEPPKVSLRQAATANAIIDLPGFSSWRRSEAGADSRELSRQVQGF